MTDRAWRRLNLFAPIVAVALSLGSWLYSGLYVAAQSQAQIEYVEKRVNDGEQALLTHEDRVVKRLDAMSARIDKLTERIDQYMLRTTHHDQ